VVEDVSEGEHKIKSQDFTSFEDERQWLDTGDTLPSDLTATEFIYGVPISLFILLRRTTELIESLPPCRPYSAGFQRNFEENVSNQRADELEREILDWSCEEELAQFASGADTETYRIIKEFTVGFHKALIIYFSQHIRLLSFRYLRPYVEIVLDCMEAIENIKTSGEILAGPVSWPMFIAASEAFDESLQQRCKAWFTLTQVYGVGAVRIGNEIIEEVWRKRSQSSQLYSTSLWRVVVEEKQKTLMLT
jgi:arginine metabolism regulation protein II